MNAQTSTGLNGHRVLTALFLAGILAMTSGITGFAHGNESGRKQQIEGAWLVQVTLRNCATNASMGSFNSLVSFHEGGTLSETTSSPGFAAGQRSPGHGEWEFEGHRTYSQRMISG